MSNSPDKNKDIPSSEKPAVKTTIVGGRPPGSGKEIDLVPRGIEILVKKASVDTDFKEILLKERAAAANRINLSLEDTEVAMLNGIPQVHLDSIISATKVSPNLKQAFMGCTAAVMLAALTATASAADNNYSGATEGIRPDDVTQIGGIRSDIVEYKETPEAYFHKAESDAKLETGTLMVRIIERVSGMPVRGIRVRFVKEGANQQVSTEGLGYTNIWGVYRIDGVPEGLYSVEVGKDSAYSSQEKKVNIVAKKENSLSLLLDKKPYNVAPAGISPQIKGISPDIPDNNTSEKVAEPYLHISGADAKLPTGTLKVEVKNRLNGVPVGKAKVYFVKTYDQGIPTGGVTEGFGYTDINSGFYRIDGVPIGKFKVIVSNDIAFYSQNKEINLLPGEGNVLTFLLDRTVSVVTTQGISPK